eukprot:TRINITY_DN11065_c1_g2_i2.p1 TRINITY_DN11065_c1_g2~~TRINITY_DN11065_c1_g2_i2.p1  ORF type:complete len:365 (+),score=72.24 TRINITY_DN11065_c1_g2_i2:83-1177(+)
MFSRAITAAVAPIVGPSSSAMSSSARLVARGSRASARALSTAAAGVRLVPCVAANLRSYPSQIRCASTTHLTEYLERCGANWNENFLPQEVQSEDGRRFRWRVDLPEERLRHLRRGQLLESPSFQISEESRARFQLYPKGDESCQDDSKCSLWLVTDNTELGPLRLKIGNVENSGGSAQFCSLQEALNGGESLEVSLELAEATGAAPRAADVVPVEQSLQLTGLEYAEWRIFNIQELLKSDTLYSSPPFRFHHVLLGDMYLELYPGPELCTLFFRCRVPTMKLQVNVSVGSAFSKSFIAVGKATYQDDLKTGSFLHVNLDAPGVLDSDGALKVNCTLEAVVSIPNGLRDMMPKLNERALWPKRL